MDIRAELRLDSSGFVKGAKDASGAIRDLGDAAVNSGKTASAGLAQAEKSAVGAAKSLGDFRKERFRIAAESRSGTEMALLMAFGKDPYNKEINERKKAEREYSDWWRKELTNRQLEANRIAKPNQQAIFGRITSPDFENSLASTRYALYDIGNRFLAFGAAIEASVVQSVQAAVRFESAFTSVERTSQLAGTSLENLRQNLIEISTTIPVAFGDVTQIATLGAQMGIAADSLDEFTETVAKFSAITGISVEETAQSFGRLAQLMDVPVSQFENLSSAVTYAGINAVATDTEIIRMSESIAAAANQAGFAAEETIGFATALASLKVRPEEARGVLVRLFREIDLSVSEGGTALNDFAKVVGTTSAAAAQLWNQNPAQFVQAFLSGAEASGRLNETITALGITNSRELNVIQRLANNMDVLSGSMADAREQFVLGTYSSEAYGKVADDLQSKLLVLQNSMEALQARFGEGFAMALKLVIDPITNLIKAAGTLHPILFAAVAGFVAITGAIILLKGALAISIAGLLAMQLATQKLGIDAAGAGLNLATLRAALQAVTGQTTVTAGVMQFLGLQMNATSVAARNLQLAMGWIGAIVAVAGVAYMVFDSMNNAAKNAGKAMFEAAGGAEAFNAAINADTEAGSKYREIQIGVESLSEAEKEAKQTALEAAVAREESKAAISGNTEALAVAEKALADFNKEIEAGNEATTENTRLIGENTAQLVLNALSKYGEGEGQDFWMQLAKLDPQTRAALDALGFEAGEFVVAGLSKSGGAEEYANKFVNAMQLLGVSGKAGAAGLKNVQESLKDMGLDLTTSQIEQLQIQLSKTGYNTSSLVAFLNSAGIAIDDYTQYSIDATAASTELASAEKAVGVEAFDAEGYVATLSESLIKYGNAAISVGEANVGINDSFYSLVQATAATTGELDGLTNESRTAMKSWSSFMRASIENAVANDTGFVGSVQTMAAGIYALGQEGVNTGYQFQQMKTFIVTSLAQTAPAFKSFGGDLALATDTTGLIKLIDAMAATVSMSAFMGKQGAKNAADFAEVMKIRDALKASIGSGTDFASVYADAIADMEKSTGKAQTALEKLLASIKSAFKYTDTFVALRGSLSSLGDSLRENGKSFDSFSENGRSNINALKSVINDLATKSGGDAQKFANDMASLRKNLVDAGVGTDGLKLIDRVLKEIGKTGKVSQASVKSFAKSLGDISKQEADLVRVVSAIRQIAQEVETALRANFAYSDSIDAVTLGWEAMAESQKQAADQIKQLKEESLDAADAITEARIAIDEANASIADLTAQRGKIQYQLQIALKYGDTIRAAELEAKLQELDAETAKERNNIAEANKNIADSQERIGEIDSELNRPKTATEIINETKALRDMASSYGNMTTFMLMNAKQGEDLNAIINQQVTAFENNAIAMGYSKEQASSVAAVLRDSLIAQIDAVNQSKMDLGITVDTETATSELDGFVSDANDLLKGVNPAKITVETSKAKNDVAAAVRSINAQTALIKDKVLTVTTVYQSTGGSSLGVIKKAAGGIVRGPGTGTSDSIAARLSNGEFVVKAAAVQHYGVDFFNALNQMKTMPSNMSMPSSTQVGGSQTVYLSTEDRQLLRAAIDRPVALYTDNAIIAQSANAGNQLLAQRGIR